MPRNQPWNVLQDREMLATLIAERLRAARAQIEVQWQRHRIRHLVVDELLPASLARAVFDAFPTHVQMTKTHGPGDYAYTAVGSHLAAQRLKEVIRAFQEPSVTGALAEVIGAPGLTPDRTLAMSGLGLMRRDCLSYPQLVPSHDTSGKHCRVLQAWYFLTPDWRVGDGGHLELWHAGPACQPSTTHAKFNRLIVMATDASAWHSTAPVLSSRPSCRILQVYCCMHGLQPHEYSHLATARARPGQRLGWLAAQGELWARRLLEELSRLASPRDRMRLSSRS